jgi:CRP/FNR family transcriptional regulator
VSTRVFDKSDLILATLHRVDLFAKWPVDVVVAMASAGRLWRYTRGERVFEANVPAPGVAVLVDGSLLIARSWANGKQMATTITRPGWPHCVLWAWDGIECPYDGVARSDLLAVIVPSADFIAAVGSDAKRLSDLVNFASAQIRQDTEALHTRAIGSPRCLMAKYLAYLARPSVHLTVEEPDAVDPTAFDVTQDELAAMLHYARQTVNRMMKTMEREGVLVREGNRLRIVDFLKLLAIMEEDEPIYPLWKEQIVAWDAKLRAGETKRQGETLPVSPRLPV